MKTYKEISDDIRGVLSDEISGTQLDILTNLLSMYVYDVQSTAVSQLLEGNFNTAININSIISKASQYGVSAPRVTNIEVEFEVKSIGAIFTITPGDEIISVGKFKFLYIGYYDSVGNFVENAVDLTSGTETLIRCLVTDKVTILEKDQIPGDIYDDAISNVASRIFAYKGQVGNLTLMRVYDIYSDYLADSEEAKLVAVTAPDYGVKITDLNAGDISRYKIIFPNALIDLNSLIGVISNKAASKYVTVSATRKGTTDQNIKVVNLGSEPLDKDSLVSYVEKNLKLTQLIKSNSDIKAYFENFLVSGSTRYNISYILGSTLNIYVDSQEYETRDSGGDNPDTSLAALIDRFYIGLTRIIVQSGQEIVATVRIKLNNQVSSDVSDKILEYINEYSSQFNTIIDEYNLIYNINSINPLIQLVEFEVVYSTSVQYNGNWYAITMSKDHYDVDVPNLDFSDIEPRENVVYKMYANKKTYLMPTLEWI